jgi:putative transposase
MAGFGFQKNTAFEWKGAMFRIERLQPDDGVVLEHVEGGKLCITTRQELLDDYAKGLIARPSSNLAVTSSRPIYSRPLDQLPKGLLDAAIRRKRYLDGILARGRPVFTPEYLTPILKEICEEIGDVTPPSATSVYRWYQRFSRSGDSRTLIPRYDRRGVHRSRQADRVMALASEAVTEAFRLSPLATGRGIHASLLGKIAAENRCAFPTDQLVAPSERTVNRMLASASLYEMTVLRDGQATADKRFRVGKAGVKSTRILERVEMDHTPLDVFLIDERTWLPLGRPTLTMLIDHFSRMPIGYYLSYGSPSAAAVVGALRHAILPKKPASPTIPTLKVEGSWPCYGIPQSLVVDNGLEFLGTDLEAISFDLGFAITQCPARQPRFKGTVERFLKTVNHNFAHQLPGASFARFHLRGDHDPQGHAILTLGEFTHVLEKWIIDIYAQRIHKGIGTTPAARWSEGIVAYEPTLPADLRLLQSRIGQSTSRKLRRDGFELKGVRYNGSQLGTILRHYGEGVEVRVVFDPEDLGEVQVWGPSDVEPIPVQAMNLEFAKGLTVRQNELIRQIVRENGARVEDRQAVLRARHEIAQALLELMTSRKQKARQRSAAIRGISSSKPDPFAPSPGAGESEGPKAKVRKQLPRKTGMQEGQDIPILLPAFKIAAKRGDHGGD